MCRESESLSDELSANPHSLRCWGSDGSVRGRSAADRPKPLRCQFQLAPSTPARSEGPKELMEAATNAQRLRGGARSSNIRHPGGPRCVPIAGRPTKQKPALQTEARSCRSGAGRKPLAFYVSSELTSDGRRSRICTPPLTRILFGILGPHAMLGSGSVQYLRWRIRWSASATGPAGMTRCQHLPAEDLRSLN